MKTHVTIVVIATLCLAFSWHPAWGDPEETSPVIDDPTVLFRTANESYEAGDYDGAIENYRWLADQGVVHADLYYNLANAYYKNNDLGNSVLFYLRSLRVRPRDTDAKENLALVRSQLRDKQFVGEQNRLVKSIVWLHNNLSTSEMIAFASASYVVLCLLAVVLIFRDSSLVVRTYRKVSLVSFGRLIGLSRAQDLLLATGVAATVFFTAAISCYQKVRLARDHSQAVVLASEIPVFSSPTDDATLQFRIHEGTVVKISAERGGWLKIELPGKMSGWVAGESIERV